jgi:chromosome partitioning protein
MPTCHFVCMKIIAVLSQKGGSGKTTLSINLAIAAAKAGQQVVVIDIDPQQSAARWSRLRTTDNPVIVSGHAPNLAQLVEQARGGGADLVVIDTAPKSESASLIAAKLANLILIPCKPSNLDLDAVADTVNIAKLAGKPAMFALNDCKAASSLTDMAAEALADYGLPIADVRIGSRVAFIKSLTVGQGVVEYEPNGPSAKEINALYTTTTTQGDM